ncbi:MAG TPA: hypothetical protein VLA00_13290 [Xanthobacteraceae bacterium]|nr:hypothetical protein [Xanthobacteraceae bacterium]
MVNPMMRARLPAIAAALGLVLLPGASGRGAQAANPPALAEPALSVPPPPVLLALLRGTLLAVNQANVTGNYSVLRDLGAPALREKQSIAALADRFRGWRDQKLDFAAVLLLDAKLTKAPSISADGVLRLAGFFPTAPLRVEFDLGFQAVDGHWRLALINLDARPAPAENTAPVAVRQVPAAALAARSTVTPPPARPAPPRLLVPTVAERNLGIPTPPGDRPRG